MPASAVTGIHGANGVWGSRRREDGGRLAVVVIVSTVEEPLGLPFVMVAGFSEQPAPESPAGRAQVKVTSAGKAIAGVVVTFNVKVAGVPAVTDRVPEVPGVTVKSVTLNDAFPEVPPPGAGLVTVTLKVPVAAISPAVIAAVTCVALTNVVALAAPLKFTTEDELRFVPFTVSVKDVPPFMAPVGESVVTVGTGLFAVNDALPEVPPPGAGFVTVTLNVPAVAISAGVIEAVTCVADTKVVVLAFPLKFTTDVATKLVPLTVSVNAAPPAVPLAGETVVIVGRGLFTVNVCAADGPVVGAGFVTVTLNVPAVAMSPAVIAAVTWVALTNVVARETPLKLSVAPVRKPVPFTVNVNAAPPTVALVGENVVIVGTGLFTMNEEFPEVPPPGAGLVTVTLNVPAAAMSGAVIAAVNWVALTKVVVRAAPLKFTTEVETKLVPFTVSVNAAPPLAALVGERVVMVGTGLFTVNVEFPDVPPPGVGLVTVTLNVPAVAISAAAMDAVTCVALTSVVVFAVPLNFTTDEALKFVPLTVSVNAAPPANPLAGESVVIVGTGLFTVNCELPDMPPPGAGLVTVTLKVPAAAISAAVMDAVTCVALTIAVVFAAPLKFTTDDELKFVPFTVSVNAAPPANPLVGESVVIVGSGLFTVNGELPDAPPPGLGLVTITLNVPAAAMSAAVIGAVTCVALTNVVVLAAPLKLTVAPETKFVPFTVSVNAAPPAVALDGDSVAIAGAGLFTANGEIPDVPPPGAGLVTVTLKVPAAAMSGAVIAAVTWVALTNVVARAAPLKFTTEPETKFDPFTVSVNAAPPASVLAGESVVIAGTGLLIVNV